MVSSGSQRTAWVESKTLPTQEHKRPFERYRTEDKVGIAFWFASGQNRANAHRFLPYLATEPALNRFHEAVAAISPLAQGQSNTYPLFRSSKAVLDAAICSMTDRQRASPCRLGGLRIAPVLQRCPHRAAAVVFYFWASLSRTRSARLAESGCDDIISSKPVRALPIAASLRNALSIALAV